MTNTQVRPKTSRTVATLSVAATTTLSDSGNGFTQADVGKLVTTANVPGGTTIQSITDPGHAVMSAAATGTSGPQSGTIGPVFTTITTGPLNLASKATVFGVTLTSGQLINALRALNQWHNATTNTTSEGQAAKALAAIGVSIQEV
jgi:hypothetical protein